MTSVNFRSHALRMTCTEEFCTEELNTSEQSFNHRYLNSTRLKMNS